MLPGLIRTLATIVLVWVVFRWLDRFFGSSRSASKTQTANRHGKKQGSQRSNRQPKDDQLGDYVDFEELKED